MRHRLLALAPTSLLAAAVLLPTAASASYTAEYVFGDSLSDRGNAAEILGANFPNPPSFHDSFTNGPVAVQVLATSLGLNADPSLWVTGFRDVNNLFGGSAYVPGTNYAVAGATAAASAVGGVSPSINLPQQVQAYSFHAGGAADPNALYTVFAGGNDVIDALRSGSGTAAVQAGAEAEAAAVQALAAEGARNLLVVNAPNIGSIPLIAAQGNPALVAAATGYSQLYNSTLAADLAALTLPAGTELTSFDFYAADQVLLANAGAIGLTNLTTPCYTNTPLSPAATAACGPNGQNISTFAFWDSIHPTAPVHALLGQEFLTALEGTAVPEPASLSLLGAGLLGLAATRRSRRGS